MMPINISYSSSPGTLVASPPKANNVDWRFWGTWGFISIMVFTIICSFVEVAPYLHMDEFIIVDLGRVLLNPETEWSLNWMAERSQPAWVWFYLGPTLQEVFFQVFGQYGPRISGVIGAIVAATTMVGWLLSRGTPKTTSLLLGVVFLLDPLFVQSYSMGRVDGWAIALCISSCWLLRNTTYSTTYDRLYKGRIILAGALPALALFTWASAAFLFPLILLELFSLAFASGYQQSNWKRYVSVFAFFLVGSTLTCIVVAIPIAPHLYAHLDNVLEGMVINTRFGPARGQSSNFNITIAPLVDLIKNLRFSLILSLIALLCVIVRRDVGVILATLAAVAIMFSTVVYIHRVLYLLPYCIISVAGIYQVKDKINLRSSIKVPLKGLILFALLLWSIGLSIVVRTALALDYRSTRDREQVYQAALSTIGVGDHAVYLPHELYYSGRSLGWRMYGSYLSVGETLSQKTLQQILDNVNYVIIQQWRVTEELSQQLDSEGMKYRGTYDVYDFPKEEFDGKTTNIVRLRNLYSIYRQPYGPYEFYERVDNMK